MIDFIGIKDRSPWCARWNSTTAGDFVIPPARRADGANQAGSNYTYREQGQLILLGVVGRVVTDAASEGFSLVQRVGTSTDTTLLTLSYTAAGHFEVDLNELWIPLTGPVYDGSPVNAGRLYVAMVGTPTTVELTAWGVWCDNKEHRELSAAPFTIRP